MHVVDGTPLLIFSCAASATYRPGREEKFPGAVWSVPGESLLGPWDFSRAGSLEHPTLYSGQLVQDRAGNWWVLGFADRPGPAFPGEVLDPLPVKVGADGLEIAESAVQP